MTELHSQPEQVRSPCGTHIEGRMHLSYFLDRAATKCVSGPMNEYRVNDLCLGVEHEMLDHGIEVGVTTIILRYGDTITAGYILDIVPHPIYGIHALFVSLDNDQSKNRMLFSDGDYSIHLIN